MGGLHWGGQARGQRWKGTLYEAIDAYLESFRAKRKSASHKHRAAQVLNINLKKTKDAEGKLIAPDCPMSEIDYRWLDLVCDKVKARPKNLKNGKPISPRPSK